MPSDHRTMAMTEDADIRLLLVQPNLSRCGKFLPFIQLMTKANCNSCSTNQGLPRKPAFLIAINIPGYSRYRRNLLQLLDDASASDIPCMQNLGHPRKVFSNGRVEQAVGIGNDANADCACAAHGSTTGWGPSDARTLAQSKVNGSGVSFGMAASSAFNRSARALLMGWVESHSVRPSSFSDSR